MSAERTVRLRAVRPAPLPPLPPPPSSPPAPAAEFGALPGNRLPPSGRPSWAAWAGAPAEPPGETGTGPRPAPAPRSRRTLGALACVVLGLGLVGGAVTGSWLTGDSRAEPPAPDTYTTARALWHSVPVDTLFPRTLKGDGAGPGGADRVWSRVAVAPDSACAGTLPPPLLRTLRPVGCERVLRATYTDSTSSSVTTVGLIFTGGDRSEMRVLRDRFTGERLAERADLMPHTLSVEGTPAAGFGEAQRATWALNVLDGAPVVVYAVSGFADGRAVQDPQSVSRATARGSRTPAAESGLGFEAKGLAARVGQGLRAAAATAATVKPR